MNTETNKEKNTIKNEKLSNVTGGTGGLHLGDNDNEPVVLIDVDKIMKVLSAQSCPGIAGAANHTIYIKDGGKALGCRTCNLTYPLS